MRILDAILGIPRKRSAQFRFIETCRKRLLKSAHADGIRLEHIEFVVPFIETDFGLSAWLFYSSQNDVQAYAADGTSQDIENRFIAELETIGYPKEWIPLVRCRFASKQEVDERFKGSYYAFVR